MNLQLRHLHTASIRKSKDLKKLSLTLEEELLIYQSLNLEMEYLRFKSTNGDTHLGGDDFDHMIIDWMAEEFLKEEGIDLRKDPMALQRLKEAQKKQKLNFPVQQQLRSISHILCRLMEFQNHLVKTLTRSNFEKICDKLIQACIEPCKLAVKDSGLSVAEIDEVLLVGGSTRITCSSAAS